MKGAIGNAFILNLVISFILIFYLLLIGSMAYSRTYKVKNYIINAIDRLESEGRANNPANILTETRDYLKKVGYTRSYNGHCANDLNERKRTSYGTYTNTQLYLNSWEYDYCVYVNVLVNNDTNTVSANMLNYTVVAYMKFDIPVIGNFIRIPIRGETKTYYRLK